MHRFLTDEIRELLHKHREWVKAYVVVDGEPTVEYKEGTPEEIKKIPEILKSTDI